MFDFRYHALSLAAVFIALVVGLLLGVAIGDRELVSSAREDLRDSLRADVREASSERDEARARVRELERFADAAFPILVAGQLSGRRIGLVLLGEDDEAPDLVREALEPSGADLALVATLRANVAPAQLAERATGTRYERLAERPELVEALGFRAGVQMVTGGRLLRRVGSALLQSVSGAFGGLDGVVVMRPPDMPADADAARRLGALQEGIVRGLVESPARAAGAQRREAEPSQIGWLREHGLSTVDNVDERAGQAALVFVLAGAEGAFGRSDGAEALLPPVVGRPG